MRENHVQKNPGFILLILCLLRRHRHCPLPCSQLFEEIDRGLPSILDALVDIGILEAVTSPIFEADNGLVCLQKSLGAGPDCLYVPKFIKSARDTCSHGKWCFETGNMVSCLLVLLVLRPNLPQAVELFPMMIVASLSRITFCSRMHVTGVRHRFRKIDDFGDDNGFAFRPRHWTILLLGGS